MGLIFAHTTLSPRELNIEFNLNIELHVALLVKLSRASLQGNTVP